MTEFKFAILLVAIIALIIGLTSVAVLLSKGDIKSQWPPFISKCPDEYVYNNSDNKCRPNYPNIFPPNAVPTSTQGKTITTDDNGGQIVNDSSCDVFDPSHRDFEGVQGNCNKKKWADDCGVSWDGVRGNESLCEDI